MVSCPLHIAHLEVYLILKAVISWGRASRSLNRVMIAVVLIPMIQLLIRPLIPEISLIPYGLPRSGFLVLILKNAGVSHLLRSSDLFLLLLLLSNHLKNTESNLR